jgi:hypothetical protein
LRAPGAILVIIPRVQHFPFEIKQVIRLSVVVIDQIVLKDVVAHGRDTVVPATKDLKVSEGKEEAKQKK